MSDFYNDDWINLGHNWIHKTAIVHDNVVMGKGNSIGPYSVVGGNGELRNTNPTEFKGSVFIGDNNMISELVTIQRPFKEGKVTKIGNNNMIMAHSHIGHDASIGSNCEICASSVIAGFVTVCDGVLVKIGVITHPRITIGKKAILGCGAIVIKNVPEGAKMVGNPARELGINKYKF